MSSQITTHNNPLNLSQQDIQHLAEYVQLLIEIDQENKFKSQGDKEVCHDNA